MDRHEAQDLAEFIDGYMEAALWSEADQLGVERGDEYPTHEIGEDTARQMRRDCAEFIVKAGTRHLEACDSYAQAGHDFWLTRNGHGAGFWDRGLGEVGDLLTDIARSFLPANLYRGDDGYIWQVGAESVPAADAGDMSTSDGLGATPVDHEPNWKAFGEHVAELIPTDDEWRSAADFMADVDALAERWHIPRVAHYQD